MQLLKQIYIVIIMIEAPYRLLITHAHIFDPSSLSSHGYFNDGNTNYSKHVLHLLQGD